MCGFSACLPALVSLPERPSAWQVSPCCPMSVVYPGTLAHACFLARSDAPMQMGLVMCRCCVGRLHTVGRIVPWQCPQCCCGPTPFLAGQPFPTLGRAEITGDPCLGTPQGRGGVPLELTLAGCPRDRFLLGWSGEDLKFPQPMLLGNGAPGESMRSSVCPGTSGQEAPGCSRG